MGKKIDLCTDCRDSFHRWLADGPEEGAEVAYIKKKLEGVRESLNEKAFQSEMLGTRVEELEEENARLKQHIERRKEQEL